MKNQDKEYAKFVSQYQRLGFMAPVSNVKGSPELNNRLLSVSDQELDKLVPTNRLPNQEPWWANAFVQWNSKSPPTDAQQQPQEEPAVAPSASFSR